MTESEAAYRAAQHEIARVAEAGETKLTFQFGAFRFLEKVPPEVAELTMLRHLQLNDTNVSDISPIATLTGLTSLNIDRTQVFDLAPLTTLTNLMSLWLERTDVFDIAPLAALKDLYELRLDKTQISDLAPLAGLKHLQKIRLDNTRVHDLAPFSATTTLRELELTNTMVRDLAPLAALSVLRRLTLDGTLVFDLRPITSMTELGVDRSSSKGLSFRRTPATKRDGRLAELAEIEDSFYRAQETLTYLRRLPPWPKSYVPAATVDGSTPEAIGVVPSPPEQDPALPLIWGDRGFSFLAKCINSDPVSEAALDDLRFLLDDLRRKGNRHDDLYRLACELRERSTGEIADLNMIKLHLSYQKLRRIHGARAARQEPFDDETLSTIEAVFDVLPGITLADDGVELLIVRQEAERAASLPPVQDAAAVKILQDVLEPHAPFAPEVKDVATELLRPGMRDRLSGTRGILSRNVVVNVLLVVGGAAAEGAIGGPVGNFVYDHGPDLLAYAATMGDDAFFWAQSVHSKFRIEYELPWGLRATSPLRRCHDGREMGGETGNRTNDRVVSSCQ